eukprot:TRINITY_DN31068_c0_g1_i2.p1 TRINITY_DN31068_c0_g1~~TRINITY_DN31068_c0_g1_i2.p1  ORF type:complete len:628 (-),score=118.13 TRINITY_DN31068_c0_g1_i2:72-1916(-)
MGAPLVPTVSIASLLRQRGNGELSQEDFFQRLAELQSLGGGSSTGSSCRPPAREVVCQPGPAAGLAAKEAARVAVQSLPESPAAAPLSRSSSWSGTGASARQQPLSEPVGPAAQPRQLFTPQPREPRGSAGRSPLDSRSLEESSSCLSSFAQRNEVWDMQRSMRRQEMRRQQEAQELAECSFQPTPAGSGAGRRSPAEGNTASRGLSPKSAAALAERLAQPSTSAPRQSRRVQAWCEQREREEQGECTFKPNISATRGSCRQTAAQAKASPGRSPPPEESSREESVAASFAPRTNPVPPGMRNARAYLQQEVFERLSRTPGHERPPSTPEPTERRYYYGGSGPSPSPLSRSSSEPTVTADSSLLRFLQRQNLCEEARQQRFEQLQAETAPRLRPELCERSVRLAERSKQRAAAGHTTQKSGAAARTQRPQTAPAEGGGANATQQDGSGSSPPPPRFACLSDEKESRFAPKITRLARQRERRSLSDLSLGDQRRREERAKRQREEHESKEASRYSFKPEVNSYNNIGSRLRVLEEPDTLIERIARSREAKLSREAKETERILRQADAENTFHPQTKDAPELVRRMAESHRAVRALREKENSLANRGKAKPRPAWQ